VRLDVQSGADIGMPQHQGSKPESSRTAAELVITVSFLRLYPGAQFPRGASPEIDLSHLWQLQGRRTVCIACECAMLGARLGARLVHIIQNWAPALSRLLPSSVRLIARHR